MPPGLIIWNKLRRRARQRADQLSVALRQLGPRRELPEPYDGKPRVALVTVSFNARELTKLMLFTLADTHPGQLGRVVVVDNRSRDGSWEFLSNISAKGIVEVVRNPGSSSHGTGLRFGIDYIQRTESDLPAGSRTNLFFVVDTDVIFLREGLLRRMAQMIAEHGVALVGELQFDVGEPYVHPSCMLLRRDAYLHPDVWPFVNHGAPALWLQRSLRRAEFRALDFPVRSGYYIVHRGRGSIGGIRLFSPGHPYSTVKASAHFHGNQQGGQLWQMTEDRHRARLGSANDAAAARYIDVRLPGTPES